MRSALLFVVLLAIAAVSPASAQQGLTQAQIFQKWAAGGHCYAQAGTKFPDHDAKSQQARDTYVNQCLTGAGLPPRTSLAPAATVPDTAANGKK